MNNRWQDLEYYGDWEPWFVDLFYALTFAMWGLYLYSQLTG